MDEIKKIVGLIIIATATVSILLCDPPAPTYNSEDIEVQKGVVVEKSKIIKGSLLASDYRVVEIELECSTEAHEFKVGRASNIEVGDTVYKIVYGSAYGEYAFLNNRLFLYDMEHLPAIDTNNAGYDFYEKHLLSK